VKGFVSSALVVLLTVGGGLGVTSAQASRGVSVVASPQHGATGGAIGGNLGLSGATGVVANLSGPGRPSPGLPDGWAPQNSRPFTLSGDRVTVVSLSFRCSEVVSLYLASTTAALAIAGAKMHAYVLDAQGYAEANKLRDWGSVTSICTQKVATSLPSGRYFLGIGAQFPWRVMVAQPDSTATSPTPGVFSDSNDAVIGPFRASTGRLAITAQFTPGGTNPENQIVELFNASTGQAVTVPSPAPAGRVPPRIDTQLKGIGDGPYYVAIRALGRWHLRVEN
jgi:hypothetical protein